MNKTPSFMDTADTAACIDADAPREVQLDVAMSVLREARGQTNYPAVETPDGARLKVAIP